MLRSKLSVFIAKRILLCFILLSIIDIIIIKQRWYVFAGLFFGGIISILKFGAYALVFSGIIPPQPGTARTKHRVGYGAVVFIISQIILLPFLYISLKLNTWLFTGFVAGILLVPFVVFINSITEAFGITHNNFE